MNAASENGKLPQELHEKVREALLYGGLADVQRTFERVGGGEHTHSALRHANHLAGDLLDEAELFDVAEGEQRYADAKALTQERARRNARRTLAEEGVRPVEFPQGTLADDLEVPSLEIKYRVEGLLPANGRAVLNGGKKDGKTTFTGNLVKSLADDEPFLGFYETHLDGRIALFNYEVDASMFREWMRDVGVVNTDRVTAPFHLRGQSLPFWTKPVKERLVEWLQENEVGFLVLDPGARAWRPLVAEENSNSQMAEFTEAVDELADEAGVREVLIVHHTGAMMHAQDNERGRGATRLGDWADVLWYLSRDDKNPEQRWFRADGRDVHQEAVALEWDSVTRSMSFTGKTRAVQRHESHLLDVLQTLAEMEEADEPATSAAFRKRVPGDNSVTGSYIKKAVDGGYVKVTDAPKNAKLHALTKKGKRKLQDGGGDDL